MKKKYLLIILNVFLVINFLFGCATIPKLQISTGKPEVIITGVTKKQVIDALTNQMLALDFKIKTITDYSAVYARRMNSIRAAVLFGSRYDSFPETRISYAIVDAPGGIRIVATMEMITNPGSAFERATDLSRGKGRPIISDMLEQLKTSLEPKY
jgi:hypothetical protein